MKPSLVVLAALLALAAPAAAAGALQKVSRLVKLPDFIPGIGDLHVDPATLPAGPFLAYDHDGRIVTMNVPLMTGALELSR